MVPRTDAHSTGGQSLAHRLHGNCTIQSVDFFCGEGNLSLAALEAGLQTVALDKTANPDHDVLKEDGLVLWLLALTATVPGALEWIASPCNSYVVLCRAQSCRVWDNHFLGDESRFFVLEGNTLGDISAMLLWLGVILMLVPALEQPANSVLPESACLSAVLHFAGAERHLTYHYCFGGATLKPLQLWSPSPFLHALRRDRPSGFSQEGGLVSRDEHGAFTGDKVQLKESQAYSKQFGKAIIKAFLSYRHH